MRFLGIVTPVWGSMLESAADWVAPWRVDPSTWPPPVTPLPPNMTKAERAAASEQLRKAIDLVAREGGDPSKA